MANNPWTDQEPVESETAKSMRRSIADEVAPDRFAWVDLINKTVRNDLRNWGEATGQSQGMIDYMWETQVAPSMFDAIYTDLIAAGDARRRSSQGILKHELLAGADPSEFKTAGMGGKYYTDTPQGINDMLDWARNWVGGQLGIPLGRFSSGSGSRGRGRRGPTAQDIRNQFDMEELTRTVNEISRGLVFQDAKNAKKIAREYVDAIVASRGEKKLDFQTFVEQKIENTARYRTIYANKPESMSARQFMAPYFQAAQQMAGPHEADELAIGGAQFGASPEAFRQRLMRTDAVTSSAPFINGLEGRLRNLNSIFKG